MKKNKTIIYVRRGSTMKPLILDSDRISQNQLNNIINKSKK